MLRQWLVLICLDCDIPHVDRQLARRTENITKSVNAGRSGVLLSLDRHKNIQEIKKYEWSNALFDICFSPRADSQYIITASGDGFLHIWNPKINKEPIKTIRGHNEEISSIDWQLSGPILSSSWDRTIKIWDPHINCCTGIFIGHTNSVYQAIFSAHNRNVVSSIAADGTLRLWDALNQHTIACIQAHDTEVLSSDWNKYNSNLLATSASDSLIRCWDIRTLRQPIFQIKSGDYPVKQIKFSPHFPYVLASASFDCTSKIWDIRHKESVDVFAYHAGFVYGLDWNGFEISELVDCSWDCTVKVFKSKALENISNKM